MPWTYWCEQYITLYADINKKVIRSFKMGKFESFKTEKIHVFRIEKKSSSGFYPRVLNVLKIARTIKSPT